MVNNFPFRILTQKYQNTRNLPVSDGFAANNFSIIVQTTLEKYSHSAILSDDFPFEAIALLLIASSLQFW